MNLDELPIYATLPHWFTNSLIQQSGVMATRNVITVFGATGAQGGGIVSTFLSDPQLQTEWTVRAVTRDRSKDSAKRLEEKGVQVVEVSSS